MGEPELVEQCGEGDTCYNWGELAELTVHQLGSCYQLHWRVTGLAVVEDCFGEAEFELLISDPSYLKILEMPTGTEDPRS